MAPPLARGEHVLDLLPVGAQRLELRLLAEEVGGDRLGGRGQPAGNRYAFSRLGDGADPEALQLGFGLLQVASGDHQLGVECQTHLDQLAALQLRRDVHELVGNRVELRSQPVALLAIERDAEEVGVLGSPSRS